MDIMQYSLVNWEQVKGESPEFTSELSSNRGTCIYNHVITVHIIESGIKYFHFHCPAVIKNGVLQCKGSSVLGLSSWKQAFFELRNGTLYQYTSEVQLHAYTPLP